ncbi:MAG: C-terminal target protein [Bacteroidota bacterium]|jgi:CubicO group peptidase (beta-lactamase class C family)|nr:C-terminal target protein [Bacteroidota bacterium]
MKHVIIIFLFSFFGSFPTNGQSLYFPPLTGTQWDSIVPSDLNYCQERIDSLYYYLELKNTKSFILLKDGKRVLEKYFGTYTRDSAWYWASAGKSLASFITGITQQKGYIQLNHKASQYLGTGWTNTPLLKEDLITIKNLLSMTSGLDDSPTPPCDNEDTAKSCLTYFADAGTRWAYHSGPYRKLHDIVSIATGQSYNSITNNWIESKTGMSGVWFQQVYYSKARDMARFGLLNLNKGIWSQDTIMKDSSYFSAMTNSSQNLNKSYGYLWWLNGKSSFMAPGSQLVIPGTLMSNAPGDMYCALGKNDQKIYVVPSSKMVVVRQGSSAGGFNLAASAFDNVLWDYINKLSCSPTFMEDHELLNHSMYPNPVTDVLTISNTNQLLHKISVYDVYGNLVHTYNCDTALIAIDFSSFSNGIYLLEMESGNHRRIRKKVIKS